MIVVPYRRGRMKREVTGVEEDGGYQNSCPEEGLLQLFHRVY